MLQRAPRGGAGSGGCMSTLATSSKAQVKRKRAPSASAAERRQGPVPSFLASSRGCSQYPRKTREKVQLGWCGGWEAAWTQAESLLKSQGPAWPSTRAQSCPSKLPEEPVPWVTPPVPGLSALTQGAGWAPTGRPMGQRMSAGLGCSSLLSSNPKDFCFLCLRFS